MSGKKTKSKNVRFFKCILNRNSLDDAALFLGYMLFNQDTGDLFGRVKDLKASELTGQDIYRLIFGRDTGKRVDFYISNTEFTKSDGSDLLPPVIYGFSKRHKYNAGKLVRWYDESGKSTELFSEKPEICRGTFLTVPVDYRKPTEEEIIIRRMLKHLQIADNIEGDDGFTEAYLEWRKFGYGRIRRAGTRKDPNA
ncbi:hypothetical protein IKX64_03185 [Candidatus Saccharibacteria bacterium]|nr:hypothetical protein [Candidatus Saccharibacteria bacterium]